MPRIPPRGFTLIELMITVAIIGILASVAIPVFNGYVVKVKWSESTQVMGQILRGVQGYYERENWDQGVVTSGSAAAAGHCTVGNTCTYGCIGLAPVSENKQIINLTGYHKQAFEALGLHFADPVYLHYAYLANGGPAQGVCGGAANSFVATVFAIGDVDGDGTIGTMEMFLATNDRNQVYVTAKTWNIGLGEEHAR